MIRTISKNKCSLDARLLSITCPYYHIFMGLFGFKKKCIFISLQSKILPKYNKCVNPAAQVEIFHVYIFVVIIKNFSDLLWWQRQRLSYSFLLAMTQIEHWLNIYTLKLRMNIYLCKIKAYLFVSSNNVFNLLPFKISSLFETAPKINIEYKDIILNECSGFEINFLCILPGLLNRINNEKKVL